MGEATRAVLDRAELRRLRHPKERSRFLLAQLVCWPLALLATGLAALTYGGALLVFGMVVLAIWFGLQIAKANLLGHAVRADEATFPWIMRFVDEARARLGVRQPVEVFVFEDGSIQAYLAKFFRTQIVVLTSGMVGRPDDAATRRQVEYVLARFVGAIAAKHTRTTFLRVLVDRLERAWVFNLLLWPYERAVQYSGDRIGLALTGDLEAAVHALQRTMVGDELGRALAPATLERQAREVDGVFGTLARLVSPFPHMVHRVRSLLAFAAVELPEQHRLLTGESGAALFLDPPGPGPAGQEAVAVPPAGGARRSSARPDLARVATVVLWLGLFSWSVSWFLPALTDHRGYDAFWQTKGMVRAVLEASPRDYLSQGSAMMLSPWTNLIVLPTVFLVWRKRTRRARTVGLVLLGASLLVNLVWAMSDGFAPDLRVGYRLWVLGFFLLAVATALLPPREAGERARATIPRGA